MAALFLAAIPTLAACAPTSPAPKAAAGAPIKIGYLTPLTGRRAKVTPDSPPDTARTAIRDGLQGLKGYKGIVGTYTMNADPGRQAWVRPN